MMNILDKVEKHIFTDVCSPLNMRGAYENVLRSMQKQVDEIPRMVDFTFEELRQYIYTHEYISSDFSKNRG
jgi:hypothetical protein